MTDALAILACEARGRGLITPPWRASMHSAQLAVLNDKGPVKCALGGRRGGKTFVGAGGCIEAGDAHKGSNVLYLALTGKNARRILWPELIRYDTRYQLGLKLDKVDQTATLPNGSTIMVAGADAEHSIERLRGYAYSRVVIDEAASFHPALLEYLCEEVLDPALMDFEGDLWMVGSPGAICAGHFHELSNGGKKSVPTYRFTIRDNPYFAGRADRILAEVLRKRGWTANTPAYLREYHGLWVRDTSSLVFDYDPQRNSVLQAPEGMTYVIAVDLGTSAKRETTAFAVLGYVRGIGSVVVHAKRHGLLCPSDVGVELDRLVKLYDPTAIVMDQGGLGSGYIEEIRRRFRLPVKGAQKRDKLGYVDLLNGDLRKGRLRIVSDACADLISEITILQWHESRQIYDDRFADHCCDAMLYAWRECRAYLEADEAAPVPLPGQDARQMAFEAAEDEDESDIPLVRRILRAS